MATDGVHVFIVNQGDGTVSVIDTLLDKVICPTLFNTPATPCTSSFPVGTSASPQPNYAVYDPKLQRVYVSNTGENTISVIKANGIDLSKGAAGLPSVLANIPVSGTPVSVTALGDGTRAYAALGNCPAGTNHTNLVLPDINTGNLASCTGNLVSVIDATALRETKTIQVGAGAVSIDSAKDGSRVYVISAHDTTTIADNVDAPGSLQPNRTFATPSVTVINTTGDAPLTTPVDPSVLSAPSPTFHTPQQDPNCKVAIDPSFNSKVPMPCPLQVPFEVRVFP
jgi:DNA-binding beta-propeller fold protein YncE